MGQKGVSAKPRDFDADGNEVHTYFRRMMKIVKDAGYRGYVEAEYEGEKPSEPDGVRATNKLLKRVGEELAEWTIRRTDRRQVKQRRLLTERNASSMLRRAFNQLRPRGAGRKGEPL